MIKVKENIVGTLEQVDMRVREFSQKYNKVTITQKDKPHGDDSMKAFDTIWIIKAYQYSERELKLIRLKYRIYEFIYQSLQTLSTRIQDFSTRFAICPDCGRNRYTGKPCK